MGRSLLAVLALCLTGCVFDGGNFATVSQDFHYSYDLKPGGRFTLDNTNGAVEITAWDQDKVEIDGTKYATTEQLRDAIKIDVHNTADSVEVHTILPSNPWGNIGAKYYIKVPRKCSLDRIVSTNGSIKAQGTEGSARIKTTNGALRISGIRCSLDAQSTNGSISLSDVQGAAVVRTTNGKVQAEQLRGALEASSTNGSIAVEIVEAEPGRGIKLSTRNGAVDLEMRKWNRNDVRVSSTNGSIKVRLPQGVDAELDARTSHASVKCEFDLTRRDEDEHKRHVRGQIGKGGALVELTTSNGSIDVRKI